MPCRHGFNYFYCKYSEFFDIHVDMEELRVARLLSSVENDSLVEVMQRFESVSSMSPEVMQNVQSTAVRCNRIDVLNELHKRGVVFTSHCLMMTICENNISAAKLVMQSIRPFGSDVES